MLLRLLCAGLAIAAASFSVAHAAPFPALSMPQAQMLSYQISDRAHLAALGTGGTKAEVERLATTREGHFDGQPVGLFNRKVTIYYRMFVNPVETRGGVIVVSGRTEGLALYDETIGDLLRNGYSVYMHDHRGQGYSSRLLGDPNDADESRGYVDDFENYVDDLQSFVEIVRSARKGSAKPLFMLAHSMGGAIASLLLERKGDAIQAVSMVTPMHEPWAAGEKQGALELHADRYCDKWAVKLPFDIPFVSTRYAEGDDFDKLRAGFDPRADPPVSVISHDSTRLALNWAARASRCAGPHCGNGTAKVGGATFRWFNQACAASREARGPAAGRIAIPVLLLQASEDVVVNPDKQVEFCDNVNASSPGRCKGYVVEGGRHGLLLEEDSYRQLTIARTLAFFQCSAEGKSGC